MYAMDLAFLTAVGLSPFKGKTLSCEKAIQLAWGKLVVLLMSRLSLKVHEWGTLSMELKSAPTTSFSVVLEMVEVWPWLVYVYFSLVYTSGQICVFLLLCGKNLWKSTIKCMGKYRSFLDIKQKKDWISAFFKFFVCIRSGNRIDESIYCQKIINSDIKRAIILKLIIPSCLPFVHL